MAERNAAKKGLKAPAKNAAAKPVKLWTDEERAAMVARAQELKADARWGPGVVDEEATVLAKIATMKAPDRAMAQRLHKVIKASAPFLTAKLWYGMPAYAKDGKVICHFVDANKFKTRYATLGFSDKANLDDGAMWPNGYALKELNPATEAKIAALVKKAAS